MACDVALAGEQSEERARARAHDATPIARARSLGKMIRDADLGRKEGTLDGGSGHKYACTFRTEIQYGSQHSNL
jgi:hypothetical protein